MNEDQRRGLEELAEWRAAMRTETAVEEIDVAGDPGADGEAPGGESSGPIERAADSAAAPSADALAPATTVKHTDATATDLDEAPLEAEGARTTDADGEGAEGEEDDEEEEQQRRRPLVDWLVVMGIALLAAFLIRTYVLAHFVVDGTSMVTTLEDGDRVFVNKLSYRLHDPRRGDVVVLHEIDETAQRDLIKRVVALPGETIEMSNCQVSIDGRVLVEPYLDPEVVRSGNCGNDFAATEIPSDRVFVMGDNRAGSMDSRVLGTIDDDDLVGRAFVVFWPSSNWRWL